MHLLTLVAGHRTGCGIWEAGATLLTPSLPLGQELHVHTSPGYWPTSLLSIPLAVELVSLHRGKKKPVQLPGVGKRGCPSERRPGLTALGHVSGKARKGHICMDTSPTEVTCTDHQGSLVGSQQQPRQEWLEMGTHLLFQVYSHPNWPS